MAYTPDAEDTAQPTGNQALSTAALEFRTLKQYIQTTKTAQAVTNAAQTTATSLVASNLAAALVAQDGRDDAQDGAISAAQADATAAIAAATAAIPTRVTNLAGSGTWTVPAGVTQITVVAQGGGTASGHTQATSGSGQFAFYTDPTFGETAIRNYAVTAGQDISYSVGVGQMVDTVTSGAALILRETIEGTDTTFGNLTARRGILRYGYNAGSYATEDNTAFALANTRKDRKFADINLGYVTGTSGNTLSQGIAGSISIFY